MFENDDIDLYQEENNPKDAKAYKTPMVLAHTK
jgi:penicillin amidase